MPNTPLARAMFRCQSQNALRLRYHGAITLLLDNTLHCICDCGIVRLAAGPYPKRLAAVALATASPLRSLGGLPRARIVLTTFSNFQIFPRQVVNLSALLVFTRGG